MRRKIHATIVAIIGIIAVLTVLFTGIYVMYNGISGDGTRETALCLAGFFVALWCGLRFPDIVYPDEAGDVASFLDKWTPF